MAGGPKLTKIFCKLNYGRFLREEFLKPGDQCLPHGRLFYCRSKDMVRETKTLGDGRTGSSFRPEDVQVPNIVIWDSTRQVQNWELAFVAGKIAEQPDNQWKIRKEMEEIYGKHKLDYMLSRDRPMRSDFLYSGLLKWKGKQENGLAQICKFAQFLRENGFPEIVQLLQP